ncbi:MAG: small multi-drug export protein [Candidatus Pacearchaeota archaeon]
MINSQILVGVLFTILPVTELRVGLPIVIEYVLRNNLPIWTYFSLVLVLNILIIIPIFIFLDFFHNFFYKNFQLYRRTFGWSVNRVRTKIRNINEKSGLVKYLLLMLFVAVPLPGTGAWTGTLIAWAAGLKRINSLIAISLGIIIAGFLILFASLGFFSLI